MKLIDTHCHIHDSEFYDVEKQIAAYENAVASETGMICAATNERSSREAIDFARTHENAWAMVGVHPHDSHDDWDFVSELLVAHRDEVIAIGEIGLDYYYDNSPRENQIKALEQQLHWAIEYDLPVSFHVRDEKAAEGEVWGDFWSIFDSFHGLRGALHSFTDTQKHLDEGFEHGLYVGVNGISTFTKDITQQELYKNIPLEKMLLETDAPFLTPYPFRGRINEPSFVGRVAERMATVHGVPLDLVSETTTANAKRLFSI